MWDIGSALDVPEILIEFVSLLGSNRVSGLYLIIGSPHRALTCRSTVDAIAGGSNGLRDAKRTIISNRRLLGIWQSPAEALLRPPSKRMLVQVNYLNVGRKLHLGTSNSPLGYALFLLSNTLRA
jgi:hypothetical protein